MQIVKCDKIHIMRRKIKIKSKSKNKDKKVG